MDLSTARWQAIGATLLYALLAGFLLREALPAGRVAIVGDALAAGLPWSAVLPPPGPSPPALDDQVLRHYPRLLEAARVYRGEADPLWTSRSGGGQPLLADPGFALLHPLTLLAAVAPVERVPLLHGFAVLGLSALFTYLFLRRLSASFPAALLGGLAFGFGGHQVLGLHEPAARVLVALPLCFLAVERLVEDRTRRRQAVLALAFALLVLGGEPGTALVAGVVAALWALYRLWDAHGRFVVLWVLLLAAGATALQWWPQLEYRAASHALWLEQLSAAAGRGGASFGAGLVFLFFLGGAWTLLTGSAERGFVLRVLAIATGVVALVMARRMGLAVSGLSIILPGLYGDPRDGVFTAARGFPALNAGFTGALPPILLAVGAVLRLGSGFTRFFAAAAFLLWGASFQMPGVDGAVRWLPGFGQLPPQALLGTCAFLVACGGAWVLDRFAAAALKPGVLAAGRRTAITLALVVLGTLAALRVPVDPHGGRTLVTGLQAPQPSDVGDGRTPVPIVLHLDRDMSELSVSVDGRVLRRGPASATAPDRPIVVPFDAPRAEEGRKRLVVEGFHDGLRRVLADQPLAVRRERRLDPRDLAFLAGSLCLAGLLVSRWRRRVPALACLVVACDLYSFGDGWQRATAREVLPPPTATIDFLRAQPPPFRVLAERGVLPPDSQYLAGVDHLLARGGPGYRRMHQLLAAVPLPADDGPEAHDLAALPLGGRRFDALDVRYVLTSRDVDLSATPGFRLVHESEARVWENVDSLGRAWIVGAALDLRRDDPALLARMDPSETVLLESAPASRLGGRGTARVTAHEGHVIRISAEVEEAPALLVLAECRGPGWTVAVNGGPPQPTLAGNIAWQAVELLPGSHDVVFRLDSAAVRRGGRLSLGCAVLLLFLLFLPRRVA